MTTYTFQFIAVDLNGNPTPFAVGSVYGPDDTAFATPLTLTDRDGTVGTTATADRLGVVTCTIDDVVRGRWKSGTTPSMPVQAWEAADAAAAAAEAAQTAAEAAASSAAAPTDAAISNVITTDLADPATPISTAVATNAESAAQAIVDPIKPDNGARAVGKSELVISASDSTYGVVGDGLADDTTALTAAMNAAASYGLDVLLKKGTYAATSLTIPAGISLRGNQATLIHAISGATFILPQSGSQLRGITIDAGAGLTTSRTVSIDGVSNVTIEGCTVKNVNSPADAIFVRNSTNVTIRYNQITGCGVGVHILGTSRYVRVEGNWINNHLDRAVYISGASTGSPSDVDILSNLVTDMAGGTSNVRGMIQATGGTGRLTRIKIDGNRVVGPNRSNTAATPGSVDQINASLVDGLIITNNTSVYGGDCGISGTSNTRELIANNYCAFNDTAGIAAGGSAGSTTTVTITGNVSVNNGQNRKGDRPLNSRTGVYLFNAHGAAVVANSLGDDQATPTQAYGLTVQHTSADVQIKDNMALGVLTGDLYWDDATNTNVDLQERRAAATPTAGYWPLGAIIKNTAPTAGGTVGWITVTAGGASNGTWAATTAYTAGQTIKLSTGKVLYCVTGGTSGSTQPTTGSLGALITDGSVTWAYIAATSAVFKTYGSIAA